MSKRLEIWSNLQNRTQEIATLTWSNLAWNSPLPRSAHSHNSAWVAAPCAAQGEREGGLASVGRIFLLPLVTEMTIEGLRAFRNKLVFLCSLDYIWQQGRRKSEAAMKLILGVCWREGKKEEEATVNKKQGEQEWKRQDSAEARSLVANSLLVLTAHLIQVTVEFLL